MSSTMTTTRRPGPTNIMTDPRVVRGSNIAAPILPPSVLAERERLRRAAEERQRRREAAALAAAELAAAQRVRTPDAVPGRAHFAIQTEAFVLEEISDRPVELNAGIQTDFPQDKPPPPRFVLAPSGVDAGTQIEDGELFDFEAKVEPILESLVGAAVDRALLELAREAELAEVRAAQDRFVAARDAELAEVARLEGEVRRRQEERARRVEQERARKAAEELVQRKVAAAAFSRTLVASLRRCVLAQLGEVGHFYDPIRREVESLVLPELLAQLDTRAALRQRVAAVLVEEVIARAVAKGRGLSGGHPARAPSGTAVPQPAAPTASASADASSGGQLETCAHAGASAPAAASAADQPPAGDPAHPTSEPPVPSAVSVPAAPDDAEKPPIGAVGAGAETTPPAESIQPQPESSARAGDTRPNARADGSDTVAAAAAQDAEAASEQ